MKNVKLGDIATIYNGNSINKAVKKEKYMKDVPGWNYIGTKDVGFDGNITYNTGVIIPYSENGFRLAPSGSVFVCSEGGSAGKKTAIVKEEVCFGNKLFAIVNEKKIYNEKYIYYYTRYEKFREQFKILATSLMGGITAKNFSMIEIPFCDLEEQEYIVSKIEELFSELDAGIMLLRTLKEQLTVYRQAVLKESFSKVGNNKRRLEELCDFITKGTTPKKDKMSRGQGDIPFIKVYNLTFNNTLDFSVDPTFVDEETHKGFLARSIVYPGDVLMNIVGPPMGKVSIVPSTYPEWNINQAIARFRCHDELNNKYLAYFLGYAQTVESMKKKAKATAGQFNLTLEICRDIYIPLPERDVQEYIVYEIENKLSKCEKIDVTIDMALQQAEAMRQSILKEAFEGRL